MSSGLSLIRGQEDDIVADGQEAPQTAADLRELPGEYGFSPIDGIAGLLLAYWRNAVLRSSCLPRQNLCSHNEG